MKPVFSRWLKTKELSSFPPKAGRKLSRFLKKAWQKLQQKQSIYFVRSQKAPKFLHNHVGVGATPQRLRRPGNPATPQARTFHKQIDSGTNDVRTEFYGCSLKLKSFAIQFLYSIIKPEGREGRGGRNRMAYECGSFSRS